MVKKNKIPTGWLDFDKVGSRVPGTRFIAFKVPLKETLCSNKLEQSEWFTPDNLLETVPKLKLIVNLTNTVSGRYYDYQFFKQNGIEILPLKCEGRGTLPPNRLINAFYKKVDDFLRIHADDNDALIGVHCTHGLNRTGLFICKYMVERMGMSGEQAIQQFQTARGHKMERMQYVDAIMQGKSNSPSSSTFKYDASVNDVNNYDNRKHGKNKNKDRTNTSHHNDHNWRMRSEHNNDYNNRSYNNYNQNQYSSRRSDYRSSSRSRMDNREAYKNSVYSANQSPRKRNIYIPPQRRDRDHKPRGGDYRSPLDDCY